VHLDSEGVFLHSREEWGNTALRDKVSGEARAQVPTNYQHYLTILPNNLFANTVSVSVIFSFFVFS